jgi:hypothetical protein
MQQIPLSPSQRYWMRVLISEHFNRGWIDTDVDLIAFDDSTDSNNVYLRVILETNTSKKVCYIDRLYKPVLVFHEGNDE